jgi:hypothetical protein
MAKRKEGCKVVWVEAPVELVERLAAVAKANHRSVNGEAVVAFERHVAAEEALRPAEPTADKAKAKKGGAR